MAYGGIIRSTDAGKTWCAPIPIGKGSGVRLDAETDFVRLKDGTLYAALRGDRVNMHFATSPDGGLTWSPVKDIGFPGALSAPHAPEHAAKSSWLTGSRSPPCTSAATTARPGRGLTR